MNSWAMMGGSDLKCSVLSVVPERMWGSDPNNLTRSCGIICTSASCFQQIDIHKTDLPDICFSLYFFFVIMC